MHRAILKNISMVMVLVLLFTWSSIPPDLVFAAKAVMPAKENLEQAAQKLEKLFDALEDAAKEIPRDTFDPKAIVDKVGRDPGKLFAWVRDNTYLVPYRGTLRGPIGVLMDRLGNSLDRALLLHELLTIAGHKAQLVRGRLSKEQAEMVLNEARPIPLGGALPVEEESGESMDELLAKYAEKYGLNPVELQRVAQKLTLQQQHMAEKVAQRVEDQTKAILELVGEPKIDIRAAERVKAIVALQDHWWVQWQRDSSWIDLDPSFPVSKLDYLMTKVDAVLQPDELGEDLLHLVVIRVVIEQWEEGDLKEHTVLQHTLQPSKLFGERIVLRHVPMNWPQDLNLFAEENPTERLKAVVLEEKEWLPVLSIGPDQVAKWSFTDSGKVKEEPGKLSGPLGGMGGLWGGMAGALTGDEPEEKESHLTAEWVEYEIRVPGEQVRTISRQVFDLVGPGARQEHKTSRMVISEAYRLNRNLLLLSETEILVSVCRASRWFVQYLRADKLLENRNVLMKSAQGQSIGSPSRVTSLPGPTSDFVVFRWTPSSISNSVFLDSPNIVTYSRQLQSQDMEVTLISGYDVVDNQVAVVHRLGVDSFWVRLAQGIADTNAERLLMENSGNVWNTAEIFDSATAQSIPWVSIRSNTKGKLSNVQVGDDVRSRIERDLSDGFVIVVPEKPVTVGGRHVISWWRVNPRNGTIIGIGEQGRGQGFTEYELKVLIISVHTYLCTLIARGVTGRPLTPGEGITTLAICAGVGTIYVAPLILPMATKVLVGLIASTLTTGIWVGSGWWN